MKGAQVMQQAVQKVSAAFPGGGFHLAAAVYLLLMFLGGCSYTEGISSATLIPGDAASGSPSLKRFAVLPFEVKVPDDETATSVSCPLCGAVFHTDHDAKTGGVAIEDIVTEHLRENKQFMLIDSGSTAEVYRRISTSADLPLADLVKQIGNELNVEGILIGYIFRYRERIGKWYSVEKPASVAFDMHLMSVNDGRIVWRASFDRTQSSLLENLFQVPSTITWGIRWFTARELAEQGVMEIVKTFPHAE